MITACLKRMYDVAISLSSLRNIHTYRNTHTLTTPHTHDATMNPDAHQAAGPTEEVPGEDKDQKC